jgi:DNA-directed RNA polymerase specialized sigma24 family protein
MDLSASTEAELLGLMAAREGGQEHAKAAWGEAHYLFAVVSRSYGRFLGEDGIADLVVDTFRRAYEWARKQTSPHELVERFSAENRDSTRRKVLGWLSSIAERLFKDRFRDDAAEAQDFALFLEHWRSSNERPGGLPASRMLTTLEAALRVARSGASSRR